MERPMIDPSTMTQEQLQTAIYDNLTATLAGKPMFREVLVDAVCVAAKSLPDAIPHDGTLWIGDRWFTLGEPNIDRDERRMSIPLVELPAYTFTVTVGPNAKSEG